MEPPFLFNTKITLPDTESKSALNESIYKPNRWYLSVLRWEYYGALSTCLFGPKKKKKQPVPYVPHMAVKLPTFPFAMFVVHKPVWTMRRKRPKTMKNGPFFTQTVLQMTLINCLWVMDVSQMCQPIASSLKNRIWKKFFLALWDCPPYCQWSGSWPL